MDSWCTFPPILARKKAHPSKVTHFFCSIELQPKNSVFDKELYCTHFISSSIYYRENQLRIKLIANYKMAN